jgi:hypothetical protein
VTFPNGATVYRGSIERKNAGAGFLKPTPASTPRKARVAFLSCTEKFICDAGGERTTT